jgi:hypothetical protein
VTTVRKRLAPEPSLRQSLNPTVLKGSNQVAATSAAPSTPALEAHRGVSGLDRSTVPLTVRRLEALKANAAILLPRASDDRLGFPEGNVPKFDPIDATLKGGEASAPRLIANASAQVRANASVENALLAELPPSRQAEYRSLRSSLSSPLSQLALQDLLMRRKLPGAQARGGAGDLLQQLATLRTQKVLPGVNRQQLLNATVAEVATPSVMNQQDRGTCSAVAVAIELASTDPAEYARLVSRLADPERSQVMLASGARLVRSASIPGIDSSGRTESHRLLIPSLMDHANGAEVYNDAPRAQRGLNGDEERALAADVLGQRIDSYGFEAKYPPDVEGLRELLANHRGPMLATVKYLDAPHTVKVEGMNAERSMVILSNPYGRQEQMPLAKFAEALHALHLGGSHPETGFGGAPFG